MWQIEFYEKPNGRCPVQDCLDDLSDRTELPYVLKALDRLAEHGYRLDRPHVAYLRDDIYELRVKTRGGHIRILYFFFLQDEIVLTHGFIKKAGRVPDAENEKVIEYPQDYYERNRGARQ